MRAEFHVAADESRSVRELAGALAFEIAAQGVDVGPPSPYGGAPDSWTIVVASQAMEPIPHCPRQLVICAAPPGTAAFEQVWRLARRATIVYDPNPAGVAEWRRRGIQARLLQVGYSSTWDRRQGEERNVDVCVLGPLTAYRARAVAAFAPHLTGYRTRILFSDFISPAAATSGDRERLELLSRTRVLIEVPDEEAGEPDRLRLAEAVSNGCAVVAESGPDYRPLRPGQELLTGPGDRLGELAVELLQDPGEWARITERAEEALRQLSLADAARQIAGDLERIGRGRISLDLKPTDMVRRLGARAARAVGMVKATPHHVAARLVVAPLTDRLRGQELQMASVLAMLKDLRLDLVDTRRQLSDGSLEHERSEEVASTPLFEEAKPEVSVVVALYNYAQYIEAALDSTLAEDFPSTEVIVVDDASSDDSAEVAFGWCERHPQVAAKLIRHRVNKGPSAARNRGIAESRSSLVLILDADNLLMPGGLRRLMAGLAEDPAAAFAYGILRTFDATGPVGLLSFSSWDPDLLSKGNYIDAMALIRKDVLQRLGGYGTDRRLQGMEDYDLWRRIAASGGHAAFVPEVVGEYRVSRVSLSRSLTAISTEVAEAVIDERCRALRNAVPG